MSFKEWKVRDMVERWILVMLEGCVFIYIVSNMRYIDCEFKVSWDIDLSWRYEVF